MTTIYFDGGQKVIKGTRETITGVGVVVYRDGFTQGFASVHRDIKPGQHEHMAFIRAMEITGLLRLSPIDVCYVTDSDVIAAMDLRPKINYSKVEATIFTSDNPNWGEAVRQQKEYDKLPSIRFSLVKSHSGIVLNEYADYLVKRGLELPIQPGLNFNCLSFNDAFFTEWVQKPQRYWDTKAEAYANKYFPFCDPDIVKELEQ